MRYFLMSRLKCSVNVILTFGDLSFLLFLQFDVKYNYPDNDATNCRALIEIKGKSVLDGLCKLGRDGFIKFPLPKHLSSVVSLSQNSFSIKDKT